MFQWFVVNHLCWWQLSKCWLHISVSWKMYICSNCCYVYWRISIQEALSWNCSSNVAWKWSTKNWMLVLCWKTDQPDGCTVSEKSEQPDGCTVLEKSEQPDGCTVSEKSEQPDRCTVSELTVNSNVIGSVELANDDDAMLQDAKDSFDVKPKKTPKPSRRSKRLKQKKAKKCQEQAYLNRSSSSGTRTTRNSQKTSKEVATANLVAKSKNHVFSYTKYGLKKPDLKKKTTHHCPPCKQLKDTYKALITHLKECHPEYKYRCKYCREMFNSNSWRYQHQLHHEGLQYKCPEPTCAKLFQFYYQVRDHWKKHSKRKVYTCETRDCLKGFTAKCALNYHKCNHDLNPNIK